MVYTKQTWNDDDDETVLSAPRLTHIEDGIYNASVASNGAVIKGELTLNVADYPSAVAAVAAAPAGSTLLFPPGVYTSPGGIGNGLTVMADNVTLQFSPGVTIQVTTWGQPGIDAYGRTGLVIKGKPTIEFTGSFGNTTGTTRGTQTDYNGAGVWINKDRCRIEGLRTIKMAVGVHVSCWNGTTIDGTIPKNVILSDIEADQAKVGILFNGVDNFTVKDVLVTNSRDDSSGAQETYAISSHIGSLDCENVTITNVRASSITTGRAINLRYTRNLNISDVTAISCRGLAKFDRCTAAQINNMRIDNCSPALLGTLAAFVYTSTIGVRPIIENITINTVAAFNQNIFNYEGLNGIISNINIRSDYSASAVNLPVFDINGSYNSFSDLKMTVNAGAFIPTLFQFGSAVSTTTGNVVKDFTTEAGTHERLVTTLLTAGSEVNEIFWDSKSTAFNTVLYSTGFSAATIKVYDRGMLRGTGSPEGVVTANVGELYQNVSGGSAVTVWVKESNGGNTGWRAVGSSDATSVSILAGSGTYNKASTAKTLHIIAVGGGGGGGSGYRGASATARLGGTGGGGGGLTTATLLASTVPAAVSYVVGGGGAGAPGQTTNSTAGLTGADGNDTTFGDLVFAGKGFGGPGGDLATAKTGGAGGRGTALGGTGGGTDNLGNALVTPYGAGTGGGGAGGGITTANTSQPGAAGGGGNSHNRPGGAGAAAGGASPGSIGSAGSALNNYIVGTGGGGGGGASAGSAGGAGGPAGGGGGGGACSVNGFVSGAGGAGANGLLIVISTS